MGRITQISQAASDSTICPPPPPISDMWFAFDGVFDMGMSQMIQQLPHQGDKYARHTAFATSCISADSPFSEIECFVDRHGDIEAITYSTV